MQAVPHDAVLISGSCL